MLRTIYAPDGERIGADVRKAHKHITGIDRHGGRYHAFEPEAYWWVLATGLDSVIAFAEHFASPTTRSDERQALDDTRELGRRFGLRDRDMQPTLEEFREWYAAILDTRLEDNPTVRDFLEVLAGPPAPPSYPDALWPPLRRRVGRAGWLSTVGTLPARALDELGLDWSRGADAQFRVIARALRLMGAAPARWRYVPIAREGFRLATADSGSPSPVSVT